MTSGNLLRGAERQRKMERTRELWGKGMTAKAIAERLSVAPATVRRWLNDIGVTGEQFKERSSWRRRKGT